MTRRAQIAALVERVEGGETGRELREALAPLFGWHLLGQAVAPWWKHNDGRSCFAGGLPAWDTSLDAQAGLPGRIVRMEWGEGKDGADLCRAYTKNGWLGTAPTEPAARLAALLRAIMETCDE